MLSFSTIFLFGSTGETITEKSGHLNLGTPGIMCLGALGGCMGERLYLSLVGIGGIQAFPAIIFGILFAMLFAAFGGAIYGFLTITLRCNQNVTGLAITTFGAGVTSFFINYINRTGFVYLSNCFRDPISTGTDWFSMLFLSHGVLVYTAIALALVVAFILKKTRGGLNLTAIGENPATADAAGINVTAYKYTAVLTGSAISGLGGLYYIMDYLNGNWEYSIDAMGWLAVALVIFSVWKPNWGILGSILFGALYIMPSYIGRAHHNQYREPQRIPAARLPRIILFQRGTVAEDTNRINVKANGTPLTKGRFHIAGILIGVIAREVSASSRTGHFQLVIQLRYFDREMTIEIVYGFAVGAENHVFR